MSTAITTRARSQFEQGQLELIRATVAKDCNNAELALFLEVCARHDLDPIIKQIWTLKINGTMQPVVSRDGLISIAQRHTPAGAYHVTGPGMHRGLSGDVVHEHDEFDPEWVMLPDGRQRVVTHHRYRDKEGKAAKGDARGPIMGAWAVVAREGFDDHYFFAKRSEYDKRVNAWKTHPSAMILKCAESVALRKAYAITGVVGEEEVESIQRRSLTATEGASEEKPVILWDKLGSSEVEARELFTNLDYREAKVRALVASCETQDDIDALMEKLRIEQGEREIPEAEVVES